MLKMGSQLLEAEITGKELLGQLKQEQEQNIKSSMTMRYKLKKPMTLLKYMYVPEAENIQLEYYNYFTLQL